MGALKLILPLLLTLETAAPAGRDWFVREGATGDGTKDKPFGDPWEALEKCEAGDGIHIAGGRYVGKLQTGQWTIPFDGVQLLGGYNADFTKRDPWANHSKLVYDKNAKNWPKDARIWVTVKDVVIDGLVVDVQEQNKYVDDPPGRHPKSLGDGEGALRSVLPVTVRNCVFINTGREAIVCGGGSTIENNLFMNTCDSAVKVNGPATAPVSTIRNNTFVWSWCDRAPGQGRYSGAGVSLGGPANITNNIFAHCDNNAIFCTIKPEKTSIQNNVFFMNLWSNFKMFVDARDVAVDDKSMELLEEAGLKAFEGNEVADPGLALDPAWMDGTAKRSAGTKGKVTMDDWNKYRQTLGLPLIATGGTPPSGVAPVYPLEKAIALMTPKKAGLKAGARIKPLEAKFVDASAAGPSKAYEKAELVAWARTPASVDGKALEMVVAISNVANVGGIPAAYKKDEHEGIFLHDGMGQERVTGFYKKGSTNNRVVNEGAGRYNGNGKADRLYVVKGTAHAVQGVPKAAFFIESIAVFEASGAARKKAAGRDWFVRAGATGGNGTKEKPFRDPFQALEKCEAGDTIHVATGEYVGKLRMGHWKIEMPDITLLGGYDKDFTARDPWKTPTLLYTPEDFKGSRNNMTIEGAEDHTGTVLDGFVFDKKLNNKYQANGDLMYSQSEKKEHVWLSKPECVVRHCVFVNGSEGAIRAHGGQTIENCIFLNHYARAVRVQQGIIPELPFVFRNNTVAFAWEPKFGQGQGRQGDLLVLGGTVRAIVDNNIFEFADNHALRVDALPKDIELTNNVFAHNLWAEVYRTLDSLVVDNKTFGSLRELGWKRLEGNVLMTPGLPLDQKWFDVYLSRTALVPGKVQMDDWNKYRELIGQPVIATGGTPGLGVSPAYDWKKALELFPKNPACKAGARPLPLAVKFEGVSRTEETFEYEETSWDVARNAADWDKLNGRRVMLKVAIKNEDNQFLLPEVKKEERSVWQVGGAQGSDAGLPMRVYVPRGTRHERVFRQAKGYAAGKPEETHLIKGVAKPNRQMLVEAVERAD